MDQDSTIAGRLMAARAARGLSPAALGEKSGVAAAQISRYEGGRTAARAEILAKLAKALDVPFVWLSDGKGDSGIPDLGRHLLANQITASIGGADTVRLTIDLHRELYTLLSTAAEERHRSVEEEAAARLLESFNFLPGNEFNMQRFLDVKHEILRELLETLEGRGVMPKRPLE